MAEIDKVRSEAEGRLKLAEKLFKDTQDYRRKIVSGALYENLEKDFNSLFTAMNVFKANILPISLARDFSVHDLTLSEKNSTKKISLVISSCVTNLLLLGDAITMGCDYSKYEELRNKTRNSLDDFERELKSL